MKERPILFSGSMVRAILDGRKTQTRRVVKTPRKRGAFTRLDRGNGWWPYQSDDGESALCSDGNEHPYSCPYGLPGDRLWVRETCTAIDVGREQEAYLYAADRSIVRPGVDGDPGRPWEYMPGADRPTVPARHMPRWASRITLEITSVRVERLQEISEADALAEGVEILGGATSTCPYRNYRIGQPGEMNLHCSCAARSFMTLWESINGPGAWARNPWVWVVEFKRLEAGDAA